MPPHEREALIGYLTENKILAPGLLLLLTTDPLWQKLEQQNNFGIWEQSTLQGERWALMLWEGLQNSFQKEAELVGADLETIGQVLEWADAGMLAQPILELRSRVAEGFLAQKGSNKSNWETAQDEFIYEKLVMDGFEIEVDKLREFVDRKKRYGNHDDHNSSTEQISEALDFFEKNGWKGQVVRVVTHGNNQINDGYVFEVMTADGKGEKVYNKYVRGLSESEEEGAQAFGGLKRDGRKIINEGKNLCGRQIQIRDERDYIKVGEIPDQLENALAHRRNADTDRWLARLRREEEDGVRQAENRMPYVGYFEVLDNFSKVGEYFMQRQFKQVFLAWQMMEMQRQLLEEEIRMGGFGESDNGSSGASGGSEPIVWESHSTIMPKLLNIDFSSWFNLNSDVVRDFIGQQNKPRVQEINAFGGKNDPELGVVENNEEYADNNERGLDTSSGHREHPEAVRQIGSYGAGPALEHPSSEAEKAGRGQIEDVKPQKTHHNLSVFGEKRGGVEQLVYVAEADQPAKKQDSDNGDEGSGGGGESGPSGDGFGGGGLMGEQIFQKTQNAQIVRVSENQKIRLPEFWISDYSIIRPARPAGGLSGPQTCLPARQVFPPAPYQMVLGSVLKPDKLMVEEKIVSRDTPKRILLEGVSEDMTISVLSVSSVSPVIREVFKNVDLPDSRMEMMESRVYIPRSYLFDRRADSLMRKVQRWVKLSQKMHYGLVCYMAILMIIDQLNFMINRLEKEAEKIVKIPKVEIFRPNWKLGPQWIRADEWEGPIDLITERDEGKRGIYRKLEESARNFAFLWLE